MSGEDYNTNYNPIMEQMMAMLSNLSNNVMTNVNSLNADMNKNNQDFNEKFEAIHAKIDTKSRLPSRPSSRAVREASGVRATIRDTSRTIPSSTSVYDRHLSRCQGRKWFCWGKPAVTIPFFVEQLLPQSTDQAHLSSPLKLEKYLTFERDMLDFQQKYNVEVRYTNYVSTDLKYEIRARFELADSDFYELSQQGLHRCLFEMIASMTKSEFLSMFNRTVQFNQNVGTFINYLSTWRSSSELLSSATVLRPGLTNFFTVNINQNHDRQWEV